MKLKLAFKPYKLKSASVITDLNHDSIDCNRNLFYTKLGVQTAKDSLCLDCKKYLEDNTYV